MRVGRPEYKCVYVLLLVLFGVNAVIFQSSHLRVCGSSAVAVVERRETARQKVKTVWQVGRFAAVVSGVRRNTPAPIDEGVGRSQSPAPAVARTLVQFREPLLQPSAASVQASPQ